MVYHKEILNENDDSVFVMILKIILVLILIPNSFLRKFYRQDSKFRRYVNNQLDLEDTLQFKRDQKINDILKMENEKDSIIKDSLNAYHFELKNYDISHKIEKLDDLDGKIEQTVTLIIKSPETMRREKLQLERDKKLNDILTNQNNLD